MTTKKRTTTPPDALAKVELRASQARVLNMFLLYGDMNDKMLKTYLHDAEKAAGFRKLMSDSGIRTRRSELSKPNEERLEELRVEWYESHGYLRDGQGWFKNEGPTFPRVSDQVRRNVESWTRDKLRAEGFRSKLWDTGKREVIDGREVTVWGLAR